MADQLNPFVALIIEVAFVLAMFLFGQWVLTSMSSGGDEEPVGRHAAPTASASI